MDARSISVLNPPDDHGAPSSFRISMCVQRAAGSTSNVSTKSCVKNGINSLCSAEEVWSKGIAQWRLTHCFTIIVRSSGDNLPKSPNGDGAAIVDMLVAIGELLFFFLSLVVVSLVVSALQK